MDDSVRSMKKNTIKTMKNIKQILKLITTAGIDIKSICYETHQKAANTHEGMEFTVVPFGQGFKDVFPPTKELMKLTLKRKIAHGGHPVLRWMMDNIFIRTDPAGNIKADKEKSTEKIDGVIATIIDLDRAIRCGNDTSESVYDDRGLLVFWIGYRYKKETKY